MRLSAESTKSLLYPLYMYINHYGFRTYRRLEIALYHALGRLPVPEMSHRFY
ncbi:hypothetical protein [Microbulbifer halophilus]|uniref:hypothetical protein n=1 Tax=Microbulbifer halophilus TaxID=453963 RepID=UPI00361E4126